VVRDWAPTVTMGRTARRWSTIAGIAWLVGFFQLLLIWAGLGLDLPLLGLALLLYGAWALALGALLLTRPTRGALLLSLAFAVVSLLLNWSALPMPSLGGPYWLAWLPDSVAALASLAALLLSRAKPFPVQRDEPEQRARGERGRRPNGEKEDRQE
jgi:hypothetical protein